MKKCYRVYVALFVLVVTVLGYSLTNKRLEGLEADPDSDSGSESESDS